MVGTTPLKASNYNFEGETDVGELALYNSKTGAIAFIESEREAIARAILRHPNAHEADGELRQWMADMSFLVSEDTDELADIRAWHERYRLADNLINITLLPAEACNFKCPYCFVYSQRNKFMAQWVYDAVLTFLEARFRRQTDDQLAVSVSWFGGEPLLATTNIVAFMHRLNGLVRKYKGRVTLRSSLSTNGYTLTRATFETLLESGVDEFQVTLDGDRDTHDKLRILKNGRPTFDAIYSNLREVSKMDVNVQFRFAVRANFLRSNIESMMRLLERFQGDFGCDDRFSIYYRPVYNFETTRSDIDAVSPAICTLREGIELQNRLAIAVMKASFANQDHYFRLFDPLPRPVYSWCNAERENAFIVGADGSIFLCDTFITDVDQRLGVIDRAGQIRLKHSASQWRLSVFEDERCTACLNCKLLPVCLGGCIRIRVQKGSPACFWTEEDIREAMLRYPNPARLTE